MQTQYPRPTFDQLRGRLAADMAGMPAVLSGPLAAAWARACHGLHGHMEWLYEQGTPLACTLDRLHDWAELYSVPRLQATPASGSVSVVGSAGASLLRDTVLRGPAGLDYRVSQGAEVANGAATAQVVCLTAGPGGNLPAGASLTLVDPIAGLADAATVTAGGLSGGAVEETEVDWRARVVDEWQTITTSGARGGRARDYPYWARASHPAVTGALVQTHTLGRGTVLVRPVCNGLPQRLPTAAVIDAVRAGLLSRAPVMPEIYVSAPVLRAVTVRLRLAASVDSAAARAAVVTAVTNAVLAESADGAVLLMSEVDAAVALVTDQYTRFAPTADITCGPGELLALPVVEWV